MFLGVIAAGVAVYTGLISIPWLTKPPEHSARYYPTDTLAYTWFTLYPSSDQRRVARDIWGRLDDRRAFRNLVEDFEDLVEEETGFEIEEDILTWIGAEISAAVLDFDLDDGEADAAITIDVRDRDVAADFLSDWRNYLEDGHGADYDKDTINDYDVWLDEHSNFAHALTPDLMVFATNERTLEDVLDRVAGKSSRTLASNEKFIEARAALSEPRFMSAYADYGGLIDVLDSDIGGGVLDLNALEDSCNEAFVRTPDWSAVSAAWVDSGLVFDFVSPTVNFLWPASPNVGNAAEVLPEGTLGFISLGFDPNLDNWREPLRDCPIADLIPDWDTLFEDVDRGIIDLIESASLLDNPDLIPVYRLDHSSTLADALDLGLWTTDQLIGVHPEEDFLNYLTGDLILAVHDVDIDSFWSSEGYPDSIHAVSMLSYRLDDEEALKAAIEDLADKFEDNTGQASDEVRVGAEDPARVFEFEGLNMASGYVFHQGYFTIGTSAKALADTVALQEGEDERLSADAEYLRTVTHLPEERQFLMYVDVGRVIGRFDLEDQIEDSDLKDVLIYSVSAAAVSTYTDAEFSRATLVLTLFPGE